MHSYNSDTLIDLWSSQNKQQCEQALMSNVKKVFDTEAGCNVVMSQSSSGSFTLDMGKGAKRSSAHDHFRNLVIQVYLPAPEERYYKIELFVKDSSQNIRRLIFSTICKGEAQVTSLHAKLPVQDTLPVELWTNLCLNAADISEQYFSGFEFRSITKVYIHGHFRLRRVFLTRDEISTINGEQDRYQIPKWLEFPVKCKNYINKVVNFSMVQQQLQAMHIVGVNRQQRNKSNVVMSHPVKGSMSPKHHKVGSLSSISSQDQSHRHQRQVKVYKAKDIMNYLHQQQDDQHSKNYSIHSLDSQPTVEVTHEKSRFKSQRGADQLKSVKTSQVGLDPYRQSGLSVYKSQELKLPKIDNKDTIESKKHNVTSSRLPPSAIQKPVNVESVRYSSSNLKLQANFKSNPSQPQKDIYTSHQALPTIKTLEQQKLYDQSDVEDRIKKKYQSKNFHRIMKEVSQVKHSARGGEDLNGWDQSDNQKSSVINESYNGISNMKKDYQPTIVTTTTKASIQIETTSSVFNNQNNSNISILHMKKGSKNDSGSQQNSFKLPHIHSYNKAYAEQHYNHQYVAPGVRSPLPNMPINENWQVTESSIQEEIIGENMHTETLNSNNLYEYGSPKIKYRESLKKIGGYGKTTDAFDRLSIDLDEDDGSQYSKFMKKDSAVKEGEDINNYMDTQNTYNQFDNLIGKQYLQRDTFTPPFMRSKINSDQ